MTENHENPENHAGRPASGAEERRNLVICQLVAGQALVTHLVFIVIHDDGEADYDNDDDEGKGDGEGDGDYYDGEADYDNGDDEGEGNYAKLCRGLNYNLLNFCIL